jgi:hypothetical protein
MRTGCAEMKKWRIDWSTYDCGYKIIDAKTRDEALKKFQAIPFEELSDREPYGEVQSIEEIS